MEDKIREPDVREKIIDAAMTDFAEKGFHGTSMKDISERAGVNKSLLFYYFGSKLNLYKEIHSYIRESFIKALDKDFQSIEDFEQRFRAVLDAYFHEFFKGMRVFRIMIREFLGMGAGLNIDFNDHIRESRKPLEEILTEGIERGIFRKVDPVFVSTAIIGMLQVFFKGMEEDQIRLRNEKLVDNIMDLLKNGVFDRSLTANES